MALLKPLKPGLIIPLPDGVTVELEITPVPPGVVVETPEAPEAPEIPQDADLDDYCSDVEARLYRRVSALLLELRTSKGATAAAERKVEQLREENRKLRKQARGLSK